MAAAIEELAADSERAAELGRQGQEFVRERFARAPVSRALLDLYEEVAAS
jgi:glycosyltransferase involved in cell wall biosynthesis